MGFGGLEQEWAEETEKHARIRKIDLSAERAMERKEEGSEDFQNKTETQFQNLIGSKFENIWTC
jgi:hypothetical protein